MHACTHAHTHQMISGSHWPLYPPARTIHMEEADMVRCKILWGQRWTRSLIRLPASFLSSTETHEFLRHTECADLVGTSQGYSRARTQEQTSREGCQRKSWGLGLAAGAIAHLLWVLDQEQAQTMQVAFGIWASSKHQSHFTDATTLRVQRRVPTAYGSYWGGEQPESVARGECLHLFPAKV